MTTIFELTEDCPSSPRVENTSVWVTDTKILATLLMQKHAVVRRTLQGWINAAERPDSQEQALVRMRGHRSVEDLVEGNVFESVCRDTLNRPHTSYELTEELVRLVQARGAWKTVPLAWLFAAKHTPETLRGLFAQREALLGRAHQALSSDRTPLPVHLAGLSRSGVVTDVEKAAASPLHGSIHSALRDFNKRLGIPTVSVYPYAPQAPAVVLRNTPLPLPPTPALPPLLPLLVRQTPSWDAGAEWAVFMEWPWRPEDTFTTPQHLSVRALYDSASRVALEAFKAAWPRHPGYCEPRYTPPSSASGKPPFGKPPFDLSLSYFRGASFWPDPPPSALSDLPEGLASSGFHDLPGALAAAEAVQAEVMKWLYLRAGLGEYPAGPADPSGRPPAYDMDDPCAPVALSDPDRVPGMPPASGPLASKGVLCLLPPSCFVGASVEAASVAPASVAPPADCVDMRAVHAHLGVAASFTAWADRLVASVGLLEGHDYAVRTHRTGQVGRARNDRLFTQSAAARALEPYAGRLSSLVGGKAPAAPAPAAAPPRPAFVPVDEDAVF